MERKFEDHKEVFATKSDINRIITWMVGLVFGQMGLIFLILELVGVFD